MKTFSDFVRAHDPSFWSESMWSSFKKGQPIYYKGKPAIFVGFRGGVGALHGKVDVKTLDGDKIIATIDQIEKRDSPYRRG